MWLHRASPPSQRPAPSYARHSATCTHQGWGVLVAKAQGDSRRNRHTRGEEEGSGALPMIDALSLTGEPQFSKNKKDPTDWGKEEKKIESVRR